MFSYVAKSLLSKTLRTFLRKYLENIDIESIDYGSTPSTAPGTYPGNSQPASGSGWGVRLSNVKLREGTELMKLPGKRKRRRVRRKKVKKEKSKKSSFVNDNDSTPITTNSKKRLNPEGGKECARPPLLPRASNCAEGSEDTPDTSDIIRGKDGILLPAETMSLHEQIQTRDRLLSVDSENGYFSSNPSTPTQSRNGICGVPSTFCLNSNSKWAAKSQQKNSSTEVPIIFNEDLFSNDHASVEDGKKESHTDQTAEKIQSQEQKKSTEDASKVPPHFEGSAVNLTNKSTDSASQCDVRNDSISRSCSDDGDASDEDSFTEAEEDFFVEDDMELLVGAGGVIGTLNIRLVGKELHVTVEDAHLIVEAVPRESSSGKGNAEKSNKDEQTKLSQPKKTNNDSRLTSPMSEDDLIGLGEEHGKSMGEKIKKKSILARYLSMIPHLFLRDCRVSLILPEKVVVNGSKTDSCDDCTVIELGIDFLSVTSGDDFFGDLRFDPGNQSTEGAHAPKSQQTHGIRRSRQISSVGNTTPGLKNNIFSRKRVRTGKGPDGGIWLKIYPPQGNTIQSHQRHPNESKWARQLFFDSSESFFLRVSGLDLHARLLLEVCDAEEDELNGMGNSWSNEYEDYTMDSMLFGVDYVDPISLTRHEIINMRRENTSNQPSDEPSNVATATNSNDIQSIPIASNFHRVAQRTHCSTCTNSHMPLDGCFYCWNECVNQNPNTISSIDNEMPLPGFVFYLSITDPLEINVDRSSLEAIEYAKTLFTSKKSLKDDQEENSEHIPDAKASTMEPDRDGEKASNVASTSVFDDKSFPSFMQPDTIYLSSLHLSTIIIRIEAIQPRIDNSLKFRFWQLIGQSIQFEQSQLDCDEQFIQDVTFHIGSMGCTDFIGACEKRLLDAGITNSSKGEVHFPCSASRILGVSAWSPTVVDERLNRPYAVHARLIRSNTPKKAARDASVSMTNVRYLNLRLGMFEVDIDATLLGDITKAYANASALFLSVSERTKKSTSNNPKSKLKNELVWLCKVSTMGGSLSYKPRIKLKIPESKFRVRRGSESLSFDTFLQTLAIEYGSYTFEQPPPPSMIPLGSLPENLRMHILLYLDDLAPLERVFNIKKKNRSPFLRSHAVSKKMAKLVASSAKERVDCQAEATRRNNILSRLQSLDTESLAALLALQHGSHNNNY